MAASISPVALPQGTNAPAGTEPLITELRALQLVNLLVKMEISTQVGGRNPALVGPERLCWAVPVWFTLPGLGMVGQVGTILVDAHTGEVLADSRSLEEIAENVKRLAERAPL